MKLVRRFLLMISAAGALLLAACSGTPQLAQFGSPPTTSMAPSQRPADLFIDHNHVARCVYVIASWGECQDSKEEPLRLTIVSYNHNQRDDDQEAALAYVVSNRAFYGSQNYIENYVGDRNSALATAQNAYATQWHAIVAANQDQLDVIAADYAARQATVHAGNQP